MMFEDHLDIKACKNIWNRMVVLFRNARTLQHLSLRNRSNRMFCLLHWLQTQTFLFMLFDVMLRRYVTTLLW